MSIFKKLYESMRKDDILLEKRVPPAKGWSEEAPSTKERHKLPASCFLLPKEEKYPICTASGKVSCKGILAAKIRAAQRHKKNLVSKADRLGKSHGCSWAKEK